MSEVMEHCPPNGFEIEERGVGGFVGERETKKRAGWSVDSIGIIHNWYRSWKNTCIVDVSRARTKTRVTSSRLVVDQMFPQAEGSSYARC